MRTEGMNNRAIAEAYRKVAVGESCAELDEASLTHVLGKRSEGYCIVSACRGDWVDYELARIGGRDGKEFAAMSKDEQNRFLDPRRWNNVKTKELQSDLRKLGLGYVPVMGGYKEGRDYANPEATPGVDVYEKSFLIPSQEGGFERVKDAALSLGAKYRQAEVLVCPPDEAPYYVVTTQYPGSDPVGTEHRWFGKNARLNDVAQEYFTSLNKVDRDARTFNEPNVRRFTFTEGAKCTSVRLAPPPMSVMEACSRSRSGEIFASQYPCEARSHIA